jgi:hypothetical protein
MPCCELTGLVVVVVILTVWSVARLLMVFGVVVDRRVKTFRCWVSHVLVVEEGCRRLRVGRPRVRAVVTRRIRVR